MEFQQKTKQTPEVVEGFFKELENPFPSLTQWEENFLISIKDQFDRTRSLSEKQFNILERIYAQKTP